MGLVYLLLAYDYCPDDPMICLCLAIASIGRAMQRQSDNRHHLVIQVSSFILIFQRNPLSPRRLWLSFPNTVNYEGPMTLECVKSNSILRELFISLVCPIILTFVITLNHIYILGLYTHAVKHYERVLEMADRCGVRYLGYLRLSTG